MIEERGRVVKVAATSVWVETIRTSTCGQCQAANACGHGVINRSIASLSRAPIQVKAGAALNIGDEVTIALSEQALLSASLLSYLVPLLVMLLLALLGHSMHWREPLVIMAACTGLALGFYGVHWWTQRFGGRFYQPVVVHRHISLSALEHGI